MSMAGMNGIQIAMTNSTFEDANECSVCLKGFYAFRHKHRCRTCGNAVCRSCASSQKRVTSRAPKNDSSRVCDKCVRQEEEELRERMRLLAIENARMRQLAEMEALQRQAMESQRALAEEAARQKQAAYDALVTKHFGDDASSAKQIFQRRHSFADIQASPHFGQDRKDWVLSLVQRADDVHFAVEKSPMITQVESVAEECAICLEVLEAGNAIYTTACGHSFHWSCLKEIKQSSSTNSDYCPSCRSGLTEVQIKKKCDHPRVRATHKFCRDCGDPVTAADVKPRPEEAGSTLPRQQTPGQPPSGGALSGATYRAGSQGALVQCPQCRIQMRVLPHMYNMRVACPQGHMFQVQVAPTSGGTMNRAPVHNPNTRGGYPGTSYNRG
ncbi:hypothetical protein H310_10104 [Aphanomyces invadans]|uniref:RING-type domain-containing protein n=1 Tax=Aphanomyces invadans TaxID=157072 RepID=A0A024TT53_9STRA|nr:hypothetical protein H310_10104 [Aphanomyces invadans]ETV96811.1 hypothetical protein H310_10104 [Aphanomyces invadans]|eukprot:XP_008874588.1 hypothetical protein H310_10104 [Aphanomyces invadans]